MFRRLALATALALTACSPAESVVATTVFTQPVPDPAAHANSLGARIAREGMAPIRETFSRMGQVTPQLEQAIGALESGIANRPARSWRVIEDVSLADTVRKVYYLHSFDGTLLYTRFDYVRDRDTWYFIGLYFSNNWEMVASPTTPGFSETRPASSHATAQP